MYHRPILHKSFLPSQLSAHLALVQTAEWKNLASPDADDNERNESQTYQECWPNRKKAFTKLYLAQCALRTMKYATCALPPIFGLLNETWNSMKHEKATNGLERWRFATVDKLASAKSQCPEVWQASSLIFTFGDDEWISFETASVLAGFILTDLLQVVYFSVKNLTKSTFPNNSRVHEKECLLEIDMWACKRRAYYTRRPAMRCRNAELFAHWPRT